MNKLTALSVIAFMLLGLTSCYTNKTLTSQQQYENYMKNKKGEYKANEKKMVLSLITKLNDTITFSKKYPGNISDTEVYGFPQFLFPVNEIDSTIFNQNAIQFIWKDGKKYEFISQNNSGYVCRLDRVNIPFQDIAQMKVRSLNKKKTTGTVVLSVTGGLTIALVLLAITFVTGW